MEDELEEKIKENMKRAFCDLVDERNTEYLKKLTEEIADRMCALVPNRRDIHVQIKSDTETVDEHTIPNIVKWLYKLQSPHLDAVVDGWRHEKISEFLYDVHGHIDIIQRECEKIKKTKRPKHTNGVPDVIRTGWI